MAKSKFSTDVETRAWQRMLSGRRLDLLDPSPLDVEVADIAHGLARVARWNGQTHGPNIFSVAQHTLLVEAVLRQQVPSADHSVRLAALLHDAPEYVIGDMISPFKAVVGGGYKTVEARLEAAIHIRFGLPAAMPQTIKALIKRADRIAAYFEATELAGFDDREARAFFGPPRGISRDMIDVAPRPAAEVETMFLERFTAIEALRRAKGG